MYTYTHHSGQNLNQEGSTELPPTSFTVPPFSTTDSALLTADVWCPPGQAHAHITAGLGIGSHSSAETLAVTP